MYFHFHNEALRELADPAGSISVPSRRKSKKEVHQTVPFGQQPVDPTSICAIEGAFLASCEVKVPSHECACREQPLQEHIGAQVHVMVAVDLHRIKSVEPAELVELRSDDQTKRPGQTRVKHNRRQPVAQQVPRQPLLMLEQSAWNVRRRKSRGEVEVEPDLHLRCEENEGFHS